MDSLWGVCVRVCIGGVPVCMCVHEWAMGCMSGTGVCACPCARVCGGVCVEACTCVQGCACVCMHGVCTYKGVHVWLCTGACMHVCGCMCGVKEMAAGAYFRFWHFSPGPPKCSDPHLHCSGPVMGKSNLTDHRLSSSWAQSGQRKRKYSGQVRTEGPGWKRRHPSTG